MKDQVRTHTVYRTRSTEITDGFIKRTPASYMPAESPSYSFLSWNLWRLARLELDIFFFFVVESAHVNQSSKARLIRYINALHNQTEFVDVT